MYGRPPVPPEEKPHLIPLDAVLAILFSISLVLLTLSSEFLMESHELWEIICFLLPAVVILGVRQSFGAVLTRVEKPASEFPAAIFLVLSAALLGLGLSGITDNIFDLSELSKELEKEIRSYGFFRQVIIFAVLPAVCEEALFRGVILNSLKSMGKWTAITLTAALFTVFHGSVELFLPIFVVSFALSVMAYGRGGLLLAAVCHFIHNFLNLLLMRWVEGDASMAAAIVMTAAGAALTAVSLLVFRKVRRDDAETKI